MKNILLKLFSSKNFSKMREERPPTQKGGFMESEVQYLGDVYYLDSNYTRNYPSSRHP